MKGRTGVRKALLADPYVSYSQLDFVSLCLARWAA